MVLPIVMLALKTRHVCHRERLAVMKAIINYLTTYVPPVRPAAKRAAAQRLAVLVLTGIL